MCLEVKIVWILFCTVVSNMAYALIAPFLPLEFIAKGVSHGMIGVIFAIYSLSVIVWSPIVSTSLLTVATPKNIIACGILSMGTCFILFGLLDDMENLVTI